MQDDEYWTLGRKEIVCISVGGLLFAALSRLIGAAPPWWFLPMPGRVERHFDRWESYAMQGGYSEFWLQSAIGWLILGAVLGLVFSNMILRGKSWD